MIDPDGEIMQCPHCKRTYPITWLEENGELVEDDDKPVVSGRN